jgi:hypothetical protein
MTKPQTDMRYKTHIAPAHPCNRIARIVLDGRPYCVVHAKLEALARLFDSGSAKLAPQENPTQLLGMHPEPADLDAS